MVSDLLSVIGSFGGGTFHRSCRNEEELSLKAALLVGLYDYFTYTVSVALDSSAGVGVS